MVQLQSTLESYPAWKAIIWCFYPITVLIIIDLITRDYDDDDDDGGGMMIPAYQVIKK